jgi:hypothetical protein
MIVISPIARDEDAQMIDLATEPYRPSSRAQLRRTVVIVVVVAVIAVLAFGWCWRTFHANELSGYVADDHGGGDVLHVGYTDYIAEDVGPPSGFYSSGHSSTLDLVSVKPLVTGDAAAAQVRVLLCSGPADVGGSSGVESDICTSPRPWSAGRVDLTRTFFVLAVTAEHPGTINTTGLQIGFRDGIRRGDQHTGTGTRFFVRP